MSASSIASPRSPPPGGLFAGAALVAALHLGALDWATRDRAAGEGDPVRRAPPMLVRSLVRPAIDANSPPAPAAAPEVRPERAQQPGTVASAGPGAASDTPASEAQAQALPGVSEVGAEPDYLPRSALTQAPQPIDMPELSYPSFEGDRGRYLAQLTLYIDEQGLVQRIDVRPADLPPALAETARRVFRAARFAPGQVDGRPVRSRLSIELTFESESAAP